MSALLDVDQLKTFVAIADTGSFTRAADIVFKTQSAVSMQMKRLEERIGKPLFSRDGRQSRLTEDGERLLEYARRIVKLSGEAISALTDADLSGHVRLGVPDDYADRFLPEILARFSRSNPRAEVTVVCEPSLTLIDRITTGALDLAIITHTGIVADAQPIRQEQLYWVTSQRGCAHEETPVPLALGTVCAWRNLAIERLDGQQRPHRVLYASQNSTALCAAVLAGLAVSVSAESSLRPGMRVLGAADGYPPLPPIKIALLRSQHDTSPVREALADHIVDSLDNLSETVMAAE
ncbi:LysR family transcriptional regulator [Flaviflagellibacter deserti]|uniref:LysR family transcriptional regulator n=1 Tax=Flaviflagellibacter deserti TaxID=2267266 RepID=A0ABV9YUW8_9HYPH